MRQTEEKTQKMGQCEVIEEIGMMQPEAKEVKKCQEAPESRGQREDSSIEPPRRCGLVEILILDFCIQNCD